MFHLQLKNNYANHMLKIRMAKCAFLIHSKTEYIMKLKVAVVINSITMLSI